MKTYNWNPNKNQQLIEERDISFENIIFHLQGNRLINDIKHPNDKNYPNQRVYIVNIDDYAYLVPYMKYFLKPSFLAVRRPKNI